LCTPRDESVDKIGLDIADYIWALTSLLAAQARSKYFKGEETDWTQLLKEIDARFGWMGGLHRRYQFREETHDSFPKLSAIDRDVVIFFREEFVMKGNKNTSIKCPHCTKGEVRAVRPWSERPELMIAIKCIDCNYEYWVLQDNSSNAEGAWSQDKKYIFCY
jgi:hypothetical protein